MSLLLRPDKHAIWRGRGGRQLASRTDDRQSTRLDEVLGQEEEIGPSKSDVHLEMSLAQAKEPVNCLLGPVQWIRSTS